ncbi:MAG: hypothetical protein JO314_02945 [Acidobacteria bacterium]|nr:hypothetical protein [Acidobacteriota bacterium]
MWSPRKKVLLKILIFIVAALLLLQIPFAYRACQISSVAQRIASTNPQPPVGSRSDGLTEYVGLLHVHSVHSGELSDAYDEMIDAACENQLDFVVLTEHYSTAFDTSAATLNGNYGSLLFVAGNEVNSRPGDRYLMVPGGSEASDYRLLPSKDVVDRIHAKGGLAVLAYPEKYEAWEAPFDGIEVANLNTILRTANPLAAALDYLWSGHVDRPLMIARYLKRTDENLKRFDDIATQRKIFMTGGPDAHSAIGFHLFGDELGEHLLGVKLDPYVDTFRLVRLHVLTYKPLDRDSLIEAMKNGAFFVGFDVLGDSRGFSFTAESDGKTSPTGTEIASAATKGNILDFGVKFHVASPIASRIVLLKNGEKIAETSHANELTFDSTTPGEYRVEVYREGLGSDFDNAPWILSNPIYIR